MSQLNETEIDVLRRTNGELVAKNATRKTLIAELKQSITDLQGQLTKANETIHDFKIGAPLRGMAAEISSLPALWLDQFNKDFRLELIEDKLTILGSDGKPLGIPFERAALSKFLTDGQDERAKTFQHLVTVSRASGAGGSNQQQSTARKPVESNRIHFGIK